MTDDVAREEGDEVGLTADLCLVPTPTMAHEPSADPDVRGCTVMPLADDVAGAPHRL